MTLAPARPDAVRRPLPVPEARVLAVLVAAESSEPLSSLLAALAAQSRRPDAVLVIDATADGRAGPEVVRPWLADIGTVVGVGVGSAAPPHRLVTDLLLSEVDEQIRDLVANHDHLWFLSAAEPEPEALARELDILRNSESARVAGPKLLLPGEDNRLRSVGYQLTRSGRLLSSPPSGETDQGQYDGLLDVLAVPLEGMLVQLDVFRQLRGFDAAFGDVGGEVDFGWRAQQAGHRVVLVPRARLRAEEDRTATPARRRQVRRVALARCSLLTAPFMAVWVVLSTVVSALALLMVKRPAAAWRELGDVGAVVNPLRPIASRWRSRGSRTVARRHLSTLFVGPKAGLDDATDRLHGGVVLGGSPAPTSTESALESGPGRDDDHVLDAMPESWLGRVLRNPGVIVTVAAGALSVVAGRTIGGAMWPRFEGGLVGGDLLGTSASSATLWHAWLDSWKGTGFGHSGEASPSLALLAVLSWLREQVPFLDPAQSPAGSAAAVLLTAALPLAAATAYLAGRAVTRRPWLRAIAALAWVTTAVASTAIASGRIGPAVALVLLPLVAAGFARSARRGGSATATFGSGLAAGVLGAFVPALLVLFAACSVVLVIVGRRGQRIRGLLLLLLPVALQGPWILELERDPRQLLAGGPGLLSWGEPVPQAWELSLLHPGGPGSFPVLLSAPLLGLAAFALLRTGRRGLALSALAVLAVVSLAGALAAPRVVLGTVPAALPHAGAPITPWTGVALLPFALAVIAAALVGASGLSLSRREAGWGAVARWPLVLGAVATVLASGGWIVTQTFGDLLASWRDPRPTVAVDQAESPVANRMVFLEPSPQLASRDTSVPAGGTTDAPMGYRLVGREVTALSRALPGTAGDPARDARLAPTISALLGGQSAGPESGSPATLLARVGVGFVGLRADETDPRIRALDATAGLVRSGTRDGVLVWRVLPPRGSSATAPTRLALVTGRAVQPVATTGLHGATRTTVTAGRGARLLVAEPLEWASHARVELDGVALRSVPGGATPEYAVPPGRGTLTVEVVTDFAAWRLAQAALLIVVLFLALPFGRRPDLAGGPLVRTTT